MITFITVIHIATIVLLVISVLLQSGKGAEISASFGGSSQTVFGSSGGQNFFQKLTYTLAGIFMVTSLTLTILPSRLKKSVLEGYSAPPASQPAASQAASGDSSSEAVPSNAQPVQTTPASQAETGKPVEQKK